MCYSADQSRRKWAAQYPPPIHDSEHLRLNSAWTSTRRLILSHNTPRVKSIALWAHPATTTRNGFGRERRDLSIVLSTSQFRTQMLCYLTLKRALSTNNKSQSPNCGTFSEEPALCFAAALTRTREPSYIILLAFHLPSSPNSPSNSVSHYGWVSSKKMLEWSLACWPRLPKIGRTLSATAAAFSTNAFSKYVASKHRC